MKFKVGDAVVILDGFMRGTQARVTDIVQEDFYHVQIGGNSMHYLYRAKELSHPNAAPEGQAGGLKFDAGKLVWDLLLNAKGMLNALEGVVRVLMFGAKKYKAHSWRAVEDAERRYLDGLMRHYIAIKRDGLLAVDPESGELHIHHLNCNGLFLAEFAEKQRNTIPTTQETV